jgi:proteasome lid subunit RPN8/RPN11
MELELASEALEAMLAHSERAAPDEACGLLLGEGAWITQASPTANIAPDPARHFEIDSQALVDAHRTERGGGPQVIGYYHSHPAGPAEPSATDRAQASRDGRVWAIVALGEVRFWRDGDDGFAPLSYALVDG